MQGIPQKPPSILTDLLSSQSASVKLEKGLQGTELTAETPSPEFLDSLRASLESLLDSGEITLEGGGTEQNLAALQHLLGQDLATAGGETLPLEGESQELTPLGLSLDGVRAVLDQIKMDQTRTTEISPVETNVILSPNAVVSMPIQNMRRVVEAVNSGVPANAPQKGEGLTVLAEPLSSLPTTTTNSPVNKTLMDEQNLLLNIRSQVGAEVTEKLSNLDASLSSSQGTSLAKPLSGAANIDARPAAQLSIPLPMSDPRWQGELNNRVAVMAKAAMAGQPQVAEIKLNPASMGPINIRVAVNDDGQTTVSFVAQQGLTREAIENSLPRLREMFNSTGLVLADADVSDHPANYSQQDQMKDEPENAQSETGVDMDVTEQLFNSGVDPANLSLVRGLDLFV